MLKKLSLCLFVLLFSIVLISCSPVSDNSAENEVSNEEWPTSPIKVICPMGPGGGCDTLGRAVTTNISNNVLKIPVIVENVEGAAGGVGVKYVLNNVENDGNTIMWFMQAHMSGARLRGTGFDVDKDFDYIAGMSEEALGVIVKKDAPWDTLEELLNDIENNPGKIKFSYQPGSAQHFGMAMLADTSLNFDVVEVPYDGGGEQRSALIGGHIDAIISGFESTIVTIGDEAKVLGLYADERHPAHPDIPTINEVLADMGVEGEVAAIGNYFFAAAPAGFAEKYPDRFETLVNAFETAGTDPEFVQEWADKGKTVFFHDPEQTRDKIIKYDNVVEKYKELVVAK